MAVVLLDLCERGSREGSVIIKWVKVEDDESKGTYRKNI